MDLSGSTNYSTMTQAVPPPVPAPTEAIQFPLDVDINAVVNDIVRDWSASPVLQTGSADMVQASLPQHLPRGGAPMSRVLNEIKSVAVAYRRRNAHPGFFGYVASPGLPTDPLGHAMTAALNQNVVGYPGSPGAAATERTVIEWFRQLCDFPVGTDGVLLSGGSLANLAALAAALYDALGEAAIRDGLVAQGHRVPIILAAESVHFSVQRAATVLGVGQNQVRSIAVDDQFRMDADTLENTLTAAQDRDELPFCVVASAGSTTTGAVDPLEAIADLCTRFGVWLHVDAAYGGAGLLAAGLRPLFSGIERADSVSMDLHKWFYLAFDGSVLLYRNPDAARRVFFSQSEYVQFDQHGPAEEHMFFHLGPELSRRFRALPAYLAFRYYGADRLGHQVQYNADCVRYLASLIEAETDLELVSPAVLSICCFRFAPVSMREDLESVDTLNRRIRDALQASGEFYLSHNDIRDRPVLRVCAISHTTQARHMEQLVEFVLAAGRALL